MNKIWKFEDILDFSYFFRLDGEREEGEEQKLHQRDRQFFLDDRPADSLQPPTPPYCLKLWLKNLRSKELNAKDSFLPGDITREAHALFRLILLFGGFFIGCGLGLSYFVYTGKTPLNVFQFLTIFIVPQLLLILLLCIKAVLSPKRKKGSSGLHKILLALFIRFFTIFKQKGLSKLSPDKHSTLAAILTKEQAALSFWPLFLASQLFGLGFNFGILAVTILKIVTTDLAFGWQSTLQLGPENLYSVVKTIALPWSWLLTPEFSYPSLVEIEGSRIVLKDGMFDLQTQNLTSWWPFLLLCLTCYGLLPRVLLLFFGFLMEQHSFRRHLQQNKYEVIIKRMLTPLVATQASRENIATKEKPVATERVRSHPFDSGDTQQPVLVLIPDEIDKNCTTTNLQELLLPHNYLPVERDKIFESYDADSALLANIAQMRWHDLKGIVILLEAWMVPIEEQIRYLHNIIESVPSETQIGICFLGRPTPVAVFAAPLKKDVEMWKMKISSLLNRIICLAPPTADTQKQ